MSADKTTQGSDFDGMGWVRNGIWAPEPCWTAEPDEEAIKQTVKSSLNLTTGRCDISFLAQGAFNKVYIVTIADKEVGHCPRHIAGRPQVEDAQRGGHVEMGPREHKPAGPRGHVIPSGPGQCDRVRVDRHVKDVRHVAGRPMEGRCFFGQGRDCPPARLVLLRDLSDPVSGHWQPFLG